MCSDYLGRVGLPIRSNEEIKVDLLKAITNSLNKKYHGPPPTLPPIEGTSLVLLLLECLNIVCSSHFQKCSSNAERNIPSRLYSKH